MASDYPVSVPSHTIKTNGVDIIDADHINTVQDDIEAICNFVGATGNPQSKHTTLLNLWRYMFAPLPKITKIDDDTIEIEAKTVVMYSGANCVLKRNTSTIQIKLSLNLDTGSEAASTWYYVWLTGDGTGTTYSAVFSASSSAPTGYTYYKLIGKIYNDSSSNIDAETVQGTVEEKPFGSWVSKSKSTVYQAATDGFVLAYMTTEGSFIYGYTDGSNPPTTKRIQSHNYTNSHGASFTMPVRKDDYWKVEESSAGDTVVWWIPQGTS